MDPITIVAIVAAGALVLFGISKAASGSPSAADQATQQGASEVLQAGVIADQTTPALQGASSNIKSTEFKTLTGAAGAGTTAGVAAAGVSGTGAGLAAGAVTFGVGALVGLAAVLWAKHEARIKGAKTENNAMNLIAPGYAQSVQGIVSAYNSNQVNDLTAVAELQQLKSLIYASIQKYNHTPGVDWAGGGSQPGLGYKNLAFNQSVKCDKHCTIGCCLFNNYIGPGINNAVDMIQKHDLTPRKIPAMIADSRYGFKGIPAFTLQLTH